MISARRAARTGYRRRVLTALSPQVVGPRMSSVGGPNAAVVVRRTPIRWMATVTIAVLTALLPVSAGALPAPLAAATQQDDSSRTTWTIQPSDGEAPDGRVSFRHEVEPGGQITDHVMVTNFSPHPATFQVHAGDGVVTSDGRFDLLADDVEPEGSGSWIAVDGQDPGAPVTVEIAAESSATVPFVIEVPADATPGDHPAGVVAALVGGQDAIALHTRVGARVHLRVAGDVVGALGVDDLRVTHLPSWNPFAAGSLRVDYALINEGNVRLGAAPEVRTTGPFGWGAREATAEEHREILPGQRVTGSVVLSGVWPWGRLSTEFAVSPLVVGEDTVDADLVRATDSAQTWALPIPQALALSLVVGAVLLWRWARGRRDARTEARIAEAVAAATAGSAADTESTTTASASPAGRTPEPPSKDDQNPAEGTGGSATDR